jgi:TPR repeat protein
MVEKHLFKLILACWLALIGWVNPGWASDVADRCQQLYKNGQYEQAFPVCSKAAEQGEAGAQFNLGRMYDHGKGVQQDDIEAVKWYRKAAEQGEVLAQFSLGQMYKNGKGVRQDDTEAAKWYRKAAEQGFALAQFGLAEMYNWGHGVQQDYAEAVKGNAKAQYNLGCMYDFGKGVQQDDTEAAKWYRKAAEQGHADAQYNLGCMYANGQGIQQDYAEAAKWFRKAAEQEDAKAQYNLGTMYYSGKGVQQDDTEAVKWYRKSAEQGCAYAQFNLAVMYALGDGVQQDYAEAVKWYRKAAEQGNAEAQHNLAVMYANGNGILQSGAAAADWYYKAGLSYLKEGKKDDSLRCVERIKNLETVLHLTVPNAFLADKLLATIYEGGAADASPAPGEKPKVKQDTISFGTGWPVLGGFVVTNYHVVKGHEEFLLLCKDGQQIPAVIAAYDAANDLVLLKATEPRKMPPALPLATRPARVGEKVFTIGYSHPTLMGAEPKLTDGIINSLTGVGNDPCTYQISIPVQAGNSGGPLLNMKGEVVGIVTAKLSAAEVFKWTGDLPQNVNYAVKAPYLSVLLSSTPDAANIRELPSGKTDLPTLASRIEPSVMIVIAE